MYPSPDPRYPSLSLAALPDTDWMNLDPELPPVEIEEAPKKWRFLPFLSGLGRLYS